MVLIDHGPFTYLRSKDLRKLKVLTSEQKQWLGNQILQKITTVTCLHERYSLSIDVLKKYRKLVGKGIIPNSTSGQPKALSATRCQLSAARCVRKITSKKNESKRNRRKVRKDGINKKLLLKK